MLRLLLRALLIVVIIVIIAGPFAFIYSGAYDVAATRQHTPWVYWALITTLRQSIQAHAAREVERPPGIDEPQLGGHGLALYERHCVVCHGAPGRAPDAIGLGLTPPPANLVYAGRKWTTAEIYWTVTKGLKMTGMPAWEFRLSERDRWAVASFVRGMATLAPAEYEALRARAAAAPEAREAGGE